jgi:tetratricopeptide (TPR) repeat protein
MSDGAFPDRLSQLKARWEADSTSRIFLQLAEEYRHLGRVREALGVLDQGLREHPGYLSALVAKGRCHLELGEGEAARSVLERVVKQDATQMVANKLLVRAYLETGDPVRARERLDLYGLLNDSDPEIEDLRRQIRQMDRPKDPSSEGSPFPGARSTAAPSPGAGARGASEDDLFDLGPAPKRGGGDVFALDETTAPRAAAPVSEPDVFPLSAAAPPLREEEPAGEGDDLFPELSARSLKQRYLSGLAAEGIFDLPGEPGEPEPFAPAASELPPPPEPADVSWLDEPAGAASEPRAAELDERDERDEDVEDVEEELPAFAEPADLWDEEPGTAEVEAEAETEEPAEALAPVLAFERPEPVAPVASVASVAPRAPAAPVETATLGDLYLRQGHADEAERIFREVLRREPDNAAARAGLETIEASRAEPAPAPAPAPAPVARPLDAGQLLADFPGPAGSGTTAKKIFLLSRYLDRLKPGSRPHVS